MKKWIFLQRVDVVPDYILIIGDQESKNFDHFAYMVVNVPEGFWA